MASFSRIKGGTYAPLSVYAGVNDLSDELSNDDPRKGLNLVFDVLGLTKDVAEVVKTVLDTVTIAREELDAAILALDGIESTAEAIEIASKLAKKIPNSIIKKLGKPIEKSAASLDENAETVSDGLIVYRDKLKIFEEKLAPVLKVATQIDAVAFWKLPALEVAINKMIDAIENQTIDLGTFLYEEFEMIRDIQGIDGAGNPIDGGDLPTPDEFGDLVLDLPDDVGALLDEAFAAWDARMDERGNEISAIQKRLDAIVDAVNFLNLEIDTTLKPSVVTPKVQADYDFGQKLAVITGLGDFLSPLTPITSAISKVYKVIKPVLDVAFLLGDLIDKGIDWVIDAVGAGGGAKAAQELVDGLVEGLNDEIEKLLNVENLLPDFNFADAFIPIIDQFEKLWLGMQSFIDAFNALENKPIIDVGEAGSQNDELEGYSILLGLAGNDTLRLAQDVNFDDGHGGYAMGGTGNDVIYGTGLKDLIFGSEGDDKAFGYGDVDLMFGGTGDDELSGGAGDDKLMGGTGNDDLRGEDGNDALYGEAGNDRLIGGSGDDLLKGGDGIDILIAGAGNDTLHGGDEDDYLFASEGVNYLDGGDGFDIYNTSGESSAVNTIDDATARVFGGAGRDIVKVGHAFATGLAIGDVSFFGGANADRFEAGSIDLVAMSPRIIDFEVLAIDGMGDAVEIWANTTDLTGFDKIEFSGADSVLLNVVSGDLKMNGYLETLTGSTKFFQFDFDDMARVTNAQDGKDATGGARNVDLTISLDDSGGVIEGPSGSTIGLTFLGGDGDDVITGGSGSDIIRAGLGADKIDGGDGDLGNRFDLDGDVGDVILGTPADLAGDEISNLTNRVDRVRIVGQDDYDVTFTSTANKTTVQVIDSNGQLSSFTLIGNYPKLITRPGTFTDENGQQVSFVDILNNNIPPTAVDDDIVTRTQRDGETPLPIDPFANDYDVDTPAQNGLARRAIEVTDTLEKLFAGGSDSFTTVLGNKVILDGTSLFYEALTPVVRLNEADFIDSSGYYDTGYDLPFFGRDQFTYEVLDAEGEVSNTAVVDILIRPDVVTNSGGQSLPEVILEIDDLYGSYFDDYVGLEHDDINGFDGFRSSTSGITAALGENKYFTITDPGTYEGGVGNDVLDARGATGSVTLIGGKLADWVEGGAFDDILSGASSFAARTENNSPADDILLGGGGNNLFLANVEGLFRVGENAIGPDRDSVFVLQGDEDIVSGPIEGLNYISAPFDILGRASPTAIAAYGLNNDTIIGFDADDLLVVPIDISGVDTDNDVTVDLYRLDALEATVYANTYGELQYDLVGFQPVQKVANPYLVFGDASTDISFDIEVSKTPGLILTSLDMSNYLGSSSDFLSTTFGANPAFDPLFFPFTDAVWDVEYLIPAGKGVTSFDDPDVIRRETLLNANSQFDLGTSTPDILSYDIEGLSTGAPAGTTPPTTRLKVSFDSFSFDTEAQLTADGEAITVDEEIWREEIPKTIPFGPQLYNELGTRVIREVYQSYDLVHKLARNEDFIDPANTYIGDGVSFEVEFDGYYNPDRFVVELAKQFTNNLTPTSFLAPEPAMETRNGYEFSYLDNSTLNFPSNGGDLAFTLKYVSSASEITDDVAFVNRGSAVTIDLINGVQGRDTDADGDAMQLFDVQLSDAQEAAFFDGDTSNGELIIETDTKTGLGTGVVTYFAAEDQSNIGPVNFTYTVTDGEFISDPGQVTINITGKPPTVSDDIVILPFDATIDSDFYHFRIYDTGTGPIIIDDDPFLPEDLILANDFDPDTGEAPRFDLTTTFSGPEVVSFPDFGLMALTAPTFEALRADPISQDGVGGSSASFTYHVEDQAGAGTSDLAKVEVFVAAQLFFDGSNGSGILNEDDTLTINLNEGRYGGFGQLEVLDPTSVKAFLRDGFGNTSEIEAGVVTISDNILQFTPMADLSGFDFEIQVEMRDALGSTTLRFFEYAIQPVDDEPELIILNADQAGRIPSFEDTSAGGELFIVDPDDIDGLTAEQAVQFLQFSTGELTKLPNDILAHLSENPKTLVNIDPSDTPGEVLVSDAGRVATFDTAQNGKVLMTLSEPGNPILFAYQHDPSPDFFGQDDVEIYYFSGDLPTQIAIGDVPTLSLRFDVLPDNDAPEFLSDLEPLVILQGTSVSVNLLADVYDRDRGADEVAALVVDLVSSDAEIGKLSLDVSDADDLADLETAGYVLEGLQSGTGTISYFVEDSAGDRSEQNTISYTVDQAPIAREDTATVFEPGATILLDLLANDVDPEGAALTYALDPLTGLPAIFIDTNGASPDAAADLMSRIQWNEAEQAFEYTAPDDLTDFGGNELFTYQILDEYGFAATGEVDIELALITAADEPQVRVSSASDQTVLATPATELFFLGEGSDSLQGSLTDLDGDTVLDLDATDTIKVTQSSPIGLTTMRDRTPFTEPAFTGTPTPIEGLFGTATNAALSQAFLGTTVLTLTEPDATQAEILLPGLFENSFTVETDGADTVIRYTREASDADMSIGSADDDDLRGGASANHIKGLGGDDVLQGYGGDDILEGGEGSDVLIGGTGRDTLIGGSGADLFVISEIGSDAQGPIFDTIVDYNPNEGDRILISAEGYLLDDFTVAFDRLDLFENPNTAGQFQLLGSPEDVDGTDVLAQINYVQEPNEAPVVSGAVTLSASDANTDVTITASELLVGASDVNGDSLSVIDLVASSGALFDNGDGTWAFTPDADDTSGVAFSYQIFDGELSVSQNAFLDLLGESSPTIDRTLPTLIGTPDRDILVGTDLAERIEGLAANDKIIGGGGDDVIVGGKGKDYQLIGGEGSDIFVFNKGDETGVIRDFEAGSDRIMFTGGIQFEDLNITQNVGLNRFTITGPEDYDSRVVAIYDGVSGPLTEDNFLFEDLTPTIFGTQDRDILVGTDLAERIEGLAANDKIIGGGGDDVIVGGKGKDYQLIGGEGSDIFVFNKGDETGVIRDFEAGSDRIMFTGGIQFEDLNISQNVGLNRFTITGPEDYDSRVVAIYEGVSGPLTEDDFMFA